MAMTLGAVNNPFATYLGLNAQGVSGGALYIGVTGMDPQTNPQACFWDAAGTIPAVQPLDVEDGYVTRLGAPAQLFTGATYSVRLRDRHGSVVFYLPNVGAVVPPIYALTDFSNVTAGNFHGSLLIRGDHDASLFYVDPAADQVSIGEYPVNPYRKFWVRQSTPDMTVAGQTIGHDAIASRMDCTGFGTAAINPNGVYGTLWYRPEANAHFTGAGAAVRGNAYTINTPGVTCDVDLMIGVYGRSRHESNLGTVAMACSFYADSAQMGGGGGPITEACAVLCTGDTLATKNYGILAYYSTPTHGLVAAKPGLAVTLGVNGIVPWSLLSTGNVLHSYPNAAGPVSHSIANQSSGAAVTAQLTLLTGTANSAMSISVQDNTGNPYTLISAGSANQGFFWNCNKFEVRDPGTGIAYYTLTSAGPNTTGVYKVAGTQVVGARGAAVADATGAGDVVAQLNALLARCRAHGLIA